MIGIQDFRRLVLTLTFNSTTIVCMHTPNLFGQYFWRDESKDHLGPIRVLLRADITSTRKSKGQASHLARIFSVALTITGLLMDKQQVMARFVEYHQKAR